MAIFMGGSTAPSAGGRIIGGATDREDSTIPRDLPILLIAPVPRRPLASARSEVGLDKDYGRAHHGLSEVVAPAPVLVIAGFAAVDRFIDVFPSGESLDTRLRRLSQVVGMLVGFSAFFSIWFVARSLGSLEGRGAVSAPRPMGLRRWMGLEARAEHEWARSKGVDRL